MSDKFATLAVPIATRGIRFVPPMGGGERKKRIQPENSFLPNPNPLGSQERNE